MSIKSDIGQAEIVADMEDKARKRRIMHMNFVEHLRARCALAQLRIGQQLTAAGKAISLHGVNGIDAVWEDYVQRIIREEGPDDGDRT